MEKSARQPNPLPQTRQQSLELALTATVIPKEAGSGSPGELWHSPLPRGWGAKARA